jgi:hypothetical protein
MVWGSALCFVLGRWLEAESVYMRPAGPCVLGHTYSIVLGQQDPPAHRISIFPLQATIHSHQNFHYALEILG